MVKKIRLFNPGGGTQAEGIKQASADQFLALPFLCDTIHITHKTQT
jgi:hypothetical protein